MYAHEHGCDWNADICAAAAANGQLICLELAHERGCPWNADTCASAAKNGYLACLTYAHERGCDWDVTNRAAYARMRECIKEYIRSMPRRLRKRRAPP